MQLEVRKVKRLLHPGPVLSKQYQHSHLALVQALCLSVSLFWWIDVDWLGFRRGFCQSAFKSWTLRPVPCLWSWQYKSECLTCGLLSLWGWRLLRFFRDQALNEVVLLGHSSDLHTSCFYWSTWGLLFRLVNKPLSVTNSNLASLLPSIGKKASTGMTFPSSLCNFTLRFLK